MADFDAKEKEVFVGHFPLLCDTVSDIESLLPHFVLMDVITVDDQKEINNISVVAKKVEKLLCHVNGLLSTGNTKSFYVMLSVMMKYGVAATRELAVKMQHAVSGKVVIEENHVDDKYGDSPPHTNNHPAGSTPTTLTDNFNTLITSTISLLEKCIDKLEVCKQDCSDLTVSDNSDILLFADKKLTDIKQCVSFQQLFDTLQEHYSWNEFSLLKRIVSKSDSVEANVKLKQFEQSMCSACKMKDIFDSSSLSDIPLDYVKLYVKVDKPFQDLTLESFQKFRAFIFQYLDIKLYVALPFTKFHFDSLHLEWYMPEHIVSHVTAAANDDDVMFAEHSIAFIQVSDKVIYDSQGKASVEVPHGFAGQSSFAFTAAKVIDKNLICPICHHLYKSPKFLPCYHSYCEECLEKMVVQSKITCPECRQEAVVPAGGVKEFADNFFINRMINDLVSRNDMDCREIKCSKCKENSVISFCPQCSSFLCYMCNRQHNLDGVSHNILHLTELSIENERIRRTSITRGPMCREHDEPLKYFCETCEELVCLYCTVKNHSGHKHDTLNKMTGQHRNELREITAPLENMIRTLSEASNSIEKIGRKVRRHGDEVDRKVDQFYDEMMQKLMKQKDQVKQQIQESVARKLRTMKKQIDEIRRTKDDMLSMKELRDAVEKSSDEEALSAKNQVVEHMQQLNEKYKKLNTLPLQSAAMEFVPNREPFPQFGSLHKDINPKASEIIDLPSCIDLDKKVEFKILTKYSTGHHCSTGGNLVSVQVKSNTGKVTYAHVKDNNNGSYTASFTSQQIGETKLSLSINGTEGNSYNTVVSYKYSEASTPSKVVDNAGCMGKPWGIAIGANGIWAITDNSKHCVYIYDNEDNLVKRFGSYGSTSSQFSFPDHLAFDSNNDLYVVDHCNNRVQKFDDQGNYRLRFGGVGSDDGRLHGPVGITTHDGMLYVTEEDNSRVSVFRTNGQFSHIIGQGQFGAPYDVVVNNNNQLFVADNTHQCIYTFTLEGQFVGKFVTQETGRGQMRYPCSLAIDFNGFLLVVELIHNQVSIFDKDGKCVHYFGTTGYAKGQFHNPRGVAISPNGNIYVSDHNNRRVQIFPTHHSK